MNYPELERLIDVVAKLRDPETGCPWDIKQSHESLLKYLIEEAYEYLQAVESKDQEHMKEELGDVLLQVVLHAQVAKDAKTFDIEDVAKTLADKLIYRHPHVFDENGKDLDADGVVSQWEDLKKEEKKDERHIDDKIINFPALMSAYKIGKKTKKIKFDWDDYHQVSYKVEEEWQELKEEITPHRELKMDKVEEELGDLLFSMAQLARHLKLDPEVALRKANQKFVRRFMAMEDLIVADKKNMDDMNQEQMDVYWDQVKEAEKRS